MGVCVGVQMAESAAGECVCQLQGVEDGMELIGRFLKPWRICGYITEYVCVRRQIIHPIRFVQSFETLNLTLNVTFEFQPCLSCNISHICIKSYFRRPF